MGEAAVQLSPYLVTEDMLFKATNTGQRAALERRLKKDGIQYQGGGTSPVFCTIFELSPSLRNKAADEIEF